MVDGDRSAATGRRPLGGGVGDPVPVPPSTPAGVPGLRHRGPVASTCTCSVLGDELTPCSRAVPVPAGRRRDPDGRAYGQNPGNARSGTTADVRALDQGAAPAGPDRSAGRSALPIRRHHRWPLAPAGSGGSADAASGDGALEGGVTEPESQRVVTGHRVRTGGAVRSVQRLGCVVSQLLHPLDRGPDVGGGGHRACRGEAGHDGRLTPP